MKYNIETKITENGWIQEMTCVFANEAIAKLILGDTETTNGYIMTGQAPGRNWAAQLRQEVKKIGVFCTNISHRVYWSTNHEANREHLEKLAQAWQEQAAEWNKIRRYVQASLTPDLRTLADEVEVHSEWLEHESEQRAKCAFRDDVWAGLDAIGERSWRNENQIAELGKVIQEHADDRKGELVDAYDCMEIDSNQAAKDRQEMREDFLRSLHVVDTLITQMEQMLAALESHIGKRFAHFRKA